MEAYMPFVWIGIAVTALVLEAASSQLVSIWFSLGAAGGAISCIFTENVIIQFSVFLIVTVLSLALTRPLVKRIKQKSVKVKTNLDRVIGCEATLTKPITRDCDGELKVMGDYWTAVSRNGKEIESGARVKVLEINSTKLVVEEVPALVN